jgi:uncharacterized protein YndB with AHSA1/START domain
MTKLKLLTGADNEIIMEREFQAPRALVIQAMSTPALIKRWLGGSRATVVTAEVERRPGGRFRYVFLRPDGIEFTISGVYREVSDDRSVHTEHFNDNPHASVVTTTWTEHGGKTTMRVVVVFDSQAVRDMVLGTGMTDGAGESYDRLEELVTSL